MPSAGHDHVGLGRSWWVLWLGARICLLRSGTEHGEGSVEAVNSSSLTSDVILQGGDILLQSGDFIIGGLELPL